MGDGNCRILKVAPGQSWILNLVASKQRHLFKLFRSGRSLVFVSLVGNQGSNRAPWATKGVVLLMFKEFVGSTFHFEFW